MLIQMESDTLRSLCESRTGEFPPARNFSEEFWSDIFDMLEECGWLEPQYNDPKYIVDNIAVNGQFHTLEDCYSEGILEQGQEPDPDWSKYGEYYCTGNLGL